MSTKVDDLRKPARIKGFPYRTIFKRFMRGETILELAFTVGASVPYVEQVIRIEASKPRPRQW